MSRNNRSRQTLAPSFDSLDGRMLPSSFAAGAVHGLAASGQGAEVSALRHRRHPVRKHHHAQATNFGGATALRGAFRTPAGLNSGALGVATGSNGGTGAVVVTNPTTGTSGGSTSAGQTQSQQAVGTTGTTQTTTSPTMFYYGTGTTADGSPVVARDASSSPTASSNPGSSPSMIYYGTGTTADGSPVVARDGTSSTSSTSSGSGFAAPGTPIPGGGGKVFGGSTTPPSDGTTINY